MRRVGEAFYDRVQAYDAVLDKRGNDALAAALARDVYAGVNALQIAAARLAAYVVQTLDTRTLEQLTRGAVRLPEPEAAPSAAAE